MRLTVENEKVYIFSGVAEDNAVADKDRVKNARGKKIKVKE